MSFQSLCRENYRCARHTGSSINHPYTAVLTVYGKTAIGNNHQGREHMLLKEVRECDDL